MMKFCSREAVSRLSVCLLAVSAVLVSGYKIHQYPVIPVHYPLFKQCEASWKDAVMENATVCDVGCLMTDIAMGLRYYNVTIDGRETDPGTLNQWLRNNGGYAPNDELEETVIEKLSTESHVVKFSGSYKGTSSISPKELRRMLEDGVVTIAHVRNGTHFVLLTGWFTDNSWAVNDPGFNETMYSYTDIVGYRLFTIKGNFN